jgi:hypothetical protein
MESCGPIRLYEFGQSAARKRFYGILRRVKCPRLDAGTIRVLSRGSDRMKFEE